MTPVKDREAKNSIALNISRSKLKPFSSVIWTRKQRFLAMWGCVSQQRLHVTSSAFALIYYKYNKYHKYTLKENISVLKVLLIISENIQVMLNFWPTVYIFQLYINIIAATRKHGRNFLPFIMVLLL